MDIRSPEFEQNDSIPSKFTCQGEDINPRLEFEDVPEGTRSLALIMDDPDAPGGTWLHWLVYDIPPDKRVIEENSVPGKEGMNSFRKKDYGGPCPPSGEHRYFFRAYALDDMLELEEETSRQEMEEAMEGHILEQCQLMGRYSKE